MHNGIADKPCSADISGKRTLRLLVSNCATGLKAILYAPARRVAITETTGAPRGKGVGWGWRSVGVVDGDPVSYLLTRSSGRYYSVEVCSNI